jgi:glutaconyl-CoA/methylmalonyl-CoA decarboxylase subunit gamma
MATYRVTVGDQIYTVEVPNVRERPVRAIVDGEVIEVQVKTTEAAPGTAPAVLRSHSTEKETTMKPARPTVSSKQRVNGDGTIKAPLPGTIVSVSVSEGERVDEGQELCILEAMKMNNPIRSTRSGVVKEILVSPGQQVDHGAPLLVLTGG